jgi:hypothetical protein
VDGALIYFQYYGLLELTPGALAIIVGSGDPTQFGDQYFVTDPGWNRGRRAPVCH